MYEHLNLKHYVADNVAKAIRELRVRAYLSNLATEQLLKLRNKTYRCSQSGEVYVEKLGTLITLESIKKELSKREHIFNKLQKIDIRRKRAQTRY